MSWISEGITKIERSLIATTLVHGWDFVREVATEPHEFFDLRLQATWKAIRTIADRSEPVDAITVERELEKQGVREAVGPLLFDLLCDPLTTVPEWNAAEIRQAWLSRETRRVCGEIASVADKDGAELLTDALRGLAALEANAPQQAESIGSLVRERMADLERIAGEKLEGKHVLTGQPTGIDSLDAKIGGWQRGIVSVVAARPGMGKSSLGLATAFGHLGGKTGGCHVFSLEDVRASYTDRAISRLAGIPSESIRACKYTREQIQCLGEAAQKLGRATGWIVDDRSGLTAVDIVRAWRRELKNNDTRTVIVDYLQIMRWPQGCRSDHEAITQNITTLADAAKADKIACVVMSQLNRDLERREDKRPMLADLRGSGSVEERAKCAIGLYRGSYYGEPTEGVDYESGERAPSRVDFESRIDLLVLKNSNGENGLVRANWNGATTRIW